MRRCGLSLLLMKRWLRHADFRWIDLERGNTLRTNHDAVTCVMWVIVGTALCVGGVWWCLMWLVTGCCGAYHKGWMLRHRSTCLCGWVTKLRLFERHRVTGIRFSRRWPFLLVSERGQVHKLGRQSLSSLLLEFSALRKKKTSNVVNPCRKIFSTVLFVVICTPTCTCRCSWTCTCNDIAKII